MAQGSALFGGQIVVVIEFLKCESGCFEGTAANAVERNGVPIGEKLPAAAEFCSTDRTGDNFMVH